MLKDKFIMLKDKFIIAGLALSSFVLLGCDDDKETELGKWDPIKLTVNGKECKTKACNVPAEGGVYSIYSKNYGSLWICDVTVNGDIVWFRNGAEEEYFDIHLSKDWYEIQYDETGNLVVKIQPKSADSPSRTIHLMLEFGDAFSWLTLLQE